MATTQRIASIGGVPMHEITRSMQTTQAALQHVDFLLDLAGEAAVQIEEGDGDIARVRYLIEIAKILNNNAIGDVYAGEGFVRRLAGEVRHG